MSDARKRRMKVIEQRHQQASSQGLNANFYSIISKPAAALSSHFVRRKTETQRKGKTRSSIRSHLSPILRLNDHSKTVVANRGCGFRAFTAAGCCSAMGRTKVIGSASKDAKDLATIVKRIFSRACLVIVVIIPV